MLKLLPTNIVQINRTSEIFQASDNIKDYASSQWKNVLKFVGTSILFLGFFQYDLFLISTIPDHLIKTKFVVLVMKNIRVIYIFTFIIEAYFVRRLLKNCKEGFAQETIKYGSLFIKVLPWIFIAISTIILGSLGLKGSFGSFYCSVNPFDNCSDFVKCTNNTSAGGYTYLGQDGADGVICAQGILFIKFN